MVKRLLFYYSLIYQVGFCLKILTYVKIYTSQKKIIRDKNCFISKKIVLFLRDTAKTQMIPRSKKGVICDISSTTCFCRFGLFMRKYENECMQLQKFILFQKMRVQSKKFKNLFELLSFAPFFYNHLIPQKMELEQLENQKVLIWCSPATLMI